MEFKIVFHDIITDINNDNIDIYVVFPDDRVFVGSLFTQTNIQHLMDKEQQDFFWASDMIIVKDLNKSTIHKTVEDLISLDYLKSAFTEVGNVTQTFPDYKTYDDILYVSLKALPR
ncbi:hypothetical protein FFF34_011555 [Inquilinus sp. KBS0705]|nr:hypothetical protein FFF34_011555 [Inquilinus sp. KBS0705]